MNLIHIVQNNQLFNILHNLKYDDIKQLCQTNVYLRTVCQNPEIRSLIQQKKMDDYPELYFIDLLFDQTISPVDKGEQLYDIGIKLENKIIKLPVEKSINVYLKFNPDKASNLFLMMRSLKDWFKLLNHADEFFPLGVWSDYPANVIIWTSKGQLFIGGRETSIILLDLNYNKQTLIYKICLEYNPYNETYVEPENDSDDESYYI